MSKTILFKKYFIYKPDFIKIDEKVIVDKMINCKDFCSNSFRILCLCDVKFRDTKNKKLFNKKFEMMD